MAYNTDHSSLLAAYDLARLGGAHSLVRFINKQQRLSRKRDWRGRRASSRKNLRAWDWDYDHSEPEEEPEPEQEPEPEPEPEPKPKVEVVQRRVGSVCEVLLGILFIIFANAVFVLTMVLL